MDQIINVAVANRELFAMFLASLLMIVKLTVWGRAKGAALDAVIRVIERLGAVEVKRAVAESEGALPVSAQDAIHDSVAKADPKKKRLSIGQKILREVARLIF